mgnify:CR=1 FL=1
MKALQTHLSEPELATLQGCEALAQQVLAPLCAGGVQHQVNRLLVRALAEHHLLQPVFRERPAAVHLCLVREGLARHCTEAETAFALQGLGGYPLQLAAGDAVRRQWVPAIASGQAVAAFALTEPGAGSDAAAIALRAAPDGHGFRLSGEKRFISNAPDADVYTVFARTGDERSRGITAFAVPGASKGLHGTRMHLVAPHPIGTLQFDDVPVSREQVLGDIGDGLSLALRTLDLFRPSVGAFAVGMGQAALDAAVRHAAERRAFGTTLSRLQGISHQLAACATGLQASRLLVHAAAHAHEQQADAASTLAAMAKLHATEAATQAIDVAIQVHGASGLVAGHPLEHLYREVRATRIYEGASEVQREIIARALFR